MKEPDLRRFKLVIGDKTLAVGCFFDLGTPEVPRSPMCAITWLGPNESMTFWPDFHHFLNISVENHVGRTLEWIDEAPFDYLRWMHHIG